MSCPTIEKPAAKPVFLRVSFDIRCRSVELLRRFVETPCLLCETLRIYLETLRIFFETTRIFCETTRTYLETMRTFTVTPHKGFENPLKIAKLMRYAAGIES